MANTTTIVDSELLQLSAGATRHRDGFVPVIRFVCKESSRGEYVAFLSEIYANEALAASDAMARATTLSQRNQRMLLELVLPLEMLPAAE